MIPSLPTNYTDKLADNNYDPIVLVEIDGDTDWYFSTRELVSAQGTGWDDYEPDINNVSDIERSLADGRAGVAVVSDVEISLSNVDPVLSNLLTTLTNGVLENKQVVIKHGFFTKLDGSAYPLADFITVFTGIVDDYEPTRKELNIRVYDANIKNERTLPQSVIDTDTYPDSHPEVQGERIPITYGVWDYAKGYQTLDTLGDQIFKFDTQTIEIINTLFAWDSDFKTFVPVADTEEDGTGAAEWVYTRALAKASFNAVTNPFAEIGLLLFRTEIEIDETVQSSAGVANPGNLWDGDINTYTRLAVDNAYSPDSDFWPATFGTLSVVGYALARYNLKQITSLGTIRHVWLQTRFEINITTVIDNEGSTIQMRYAFFQITPNTDGDFVGGGYITTGSRGEIYLVESDFRNIGSTPPDEIYDIDLAPQVIGANDTNTIGSSGGQGSGGGIRWKLNGWDTINNGRLVVGGLYQMSTAVDFDFDIYEAYLLITHTLRFDEAPELYAEMTGREFGSTWNSRKTAGDPVLKASEVIEGIFRHELELTDSDIDDASFDAVNSALDASVESGDYDLALQVLEEISSTELLDSVCKQATLRQFKRYDGTETVKDLDITASSDADFTEDNIIKDTLGYTRENSSEVYSEIFVNYNYNNASGKFEGVAWVTPDDNNLSRSDESTLEGLCATCETNYGTRNRLTIDATAIREQDVAEGLIARLLLDEKVSQHHWLISFDAFLSESAALELGDTITVTDDLLPTAVDGGKSEVIRLAPLYIDSVCTITARSFAGE